MQQGLVMWSPPSGEVGGVKREIAKNSWDEQNAGMLRDAHIICAVRIAFFFFHELALV